VTKGRREGSKHRTNDNGARVIGDLLARQSSLMCQLSGPKLASARKKAAEVLKDTADRHAANVIPAIQEVRKADASTLCKRLQTLPTPVTSRPRAVAKLL